jgi:hypothetical protein
MERRHLFEDLALLLVGLLGAWLLLAPARGEFGRGFDGFQGAFFASAAVNYERLGVERTHGFPVVQIDPRDEPSTWNVYTNHPRAVPLLAWWSLRTFGPAGWSDRAQPLPHDTEAALRVPFFAAQVLCCVLVGLVAAAAAGRRAGLLGFALAVHAPLAAPLAGLVNYEHPSLVFVLAGALCLALAHVRRERAGLLGVLATAVCGAGAFVTYAPVLFVPAFALFAPRRRLLALSTGCASAGLALVPHVLATRALRADTGLAGPSLVGRARELIAPMLHGDPPPWRWLAIQWDSALTAFGAALVAAAILGFLAAVRLARAGHAHAEIERAESGPVARGPAVLARMALAAGLGALLVQVLYWRHTSDPQESFLLNAAPAVVLAAVLAFASIERRSATGWPYRIARVLPLAVLAACIVQSTQRLSADRAPGPLDLAGARGPDAPLPRTVGEELARLLPADVSGWYPSTLGWTPAASFHAWRPLVPVSPGAYDAAAATAVALGYGDRPVWLVLPLEPRGEAQARECELLAAELAARRGAEPDWVSGRWLRVAALRR